MEFSDWDVDKYENPTEPKHHWALKRSFMEENMHRSGLAAAFLDLPIVKKILKGLEKSSVFLIYYVTVFVGTSP